MADARQASPDRIIFYFLEQRTTLVIVAVSGLIYNLGLLAGPWFEGRLIQCLMRILQGRDVFSSMLRLAGCYIAVITAVQAARFIKRLYVRRFANNVGLKMKQVLYANLVRCSKSELDGEGAGSAMTKAISDVDDCAEGMRKCTTEVFDTGVAMLGYIGMLLWYDWRLALLCLIFPSISYILAEKMKVPVQSAGFSLKQQASLLRSFTLDRIDNAVTYRIFGCESQRNEAYEAQLTDYEHAAIRSNILSGALAPLYQILSMTGVFFILFYGARNVLQVGWTGWDIAAFTTFLSCFVKLSAKSAKAAKLFNAVHKAQVSWNRIRPLMHAPSAPEKTIPFCGALCVQDLLLSAADGTILCSGLQLHARPGQIIGISGSVGCGKSSLGRAFLCETPYAGSIRIAGTQLSDLSPAQRRGLIGYLGHDPELMTDTIENNILLGDPGDALTALKSVCMDAEVLSMENGMQTVVGSGGVRLSGGQAQRLALARTLQHIKPLLILDDPFSALDRATEEQIFARLRVLARDSVVLLISHRLYLFPYLDAVVWMQDGHAQTAPHAALMQQNAQYARLFLDQEENTHES